MGVDARFLDDGSIIRKGQLKVEVDEEQVDEHEEIIEPEPEQQPKVEQKKKKAKKPAASKQTTRPAVEDKRIIALRELIDKTELQRASRWVDVRVNQRLYNMAMSNEDRQRCEAQYTSGGKDLKMIDLRLEVMREMLDELMNGGGADGGRG